MPLYVDREASKLWRKIYTEALIEISLLADNWKFILAGLYIHGLAAHGVHYLHQPGPRLQDAGFSLLPELAQNKFFISETVFTLIFCSFVLVSQLLRILTFYSTQLPGPTFHCREGSELATLPPPKSVLEFYLINFPEGVIYGCGDSIFSSHMIFTLVFVHTHQKYGTKRCIKQFAWLLAVVQSFLIIASRKHYSVDIVVAWYAVNLVAFFVERKLPELPERSTGPIASPLLPLSTRNKDGKEKEENQQLINGNSLVTESSA